MPGGFTSSGREGYQTVDEPREQPARPTGPPPANAPAPPGAYQAV